MSAYPEGTFKIMYIVVHVADFNLKTWQPFSHLLAIDVLNTIMEEAKKFIFLLLWS